jgi:hypothetical protein
MSCASSSGVGPAASTARRTAPNRAPTYSPTPGLARSPVRVPACRRCGPGPARNRRRPGRETGPSLAGRGPCRPPAPVLIGLLDRSSTSRVRRRPRRVEGLSAAGRSSSRRGARRRAGRRGPWPGAGSRSDQPTRPRSRCSSCADRSGGRPAGHPSWHCRCASSQPLPAGRARCHGGGRIGRCPVRCARGQGRHRSVLCAGLADDRHGRLAGRAPRVAGLPGRDVHYGERMDRMLA